MEEGNPHKRKPSVCSSLFPFQSYPCTLWGKSMKGRTCALSVVLKQHPLCLGTGHQWLLSQRSQQVRIVIVILENISVCLQHAVLLLLGCSPYPLSTGTSSSFLTHVPSPHQSNWAPKHSASIHSIFGISIFTAQPHYGHQVLDERGKARSTLPWVSQPKLIEHF